MMFYVKEIAGGLFFAAQMAILVWLMSAL